MNSIELYRDLRKIYPADSIMVGNFVNPALHRHFFPNVQLIDHSGNIIPPYFSKADTILIADPLAGEFYNLPIEGFVLCPKSDNEWSAFQVLVSHEGKKITSSGILLKRSQDDLLKELSDLFRINWYRIDETSSIIPVN